MKKIAKLEKIKKNAEIILPSSKSYLNRALIVASIQNYKTKLTNVTDICNDVNDLIQVLRQLGVKIDIKYKKASVNKTIEVFGNNNNFIKPKNGIINCGLGGTTTRFLLGLSVLFDFDVVITATGKMLERPINDLIDAIRILGKNIEYLNKNNFLPLKISGRINKNVDKIEIDCSKSSQFLSSMLLIAKQIGLKQIVAKNVVSKSYIDITKTILNQFESCVKLVEIKKDLVCNINQKIKYDYIEKQMPIEIDWSSASYFLALSFLFKTKLKINGLNKKTSQGDGKIIDIINKIKNFKVANDNNKILEINMENIPDTSMTVMVVCCFQDFNTKLIGLQTLKNKECDRLKAMHNEFAKIGIKTEISTKYDAITIYGNSKITLEKDIEIETYNDHRIAMCFTIVGAKLGHIIIKNPYVVKKSFPNFWQEFKKLNLND